MKKYVIIMIIGAAVIAMGISASADEEKLIERINSREVGPEDGSINEPIIEPVIYDEINDEIIIAPNPDTVVEHNTEDGKRTIDDTIISPNPYGGETGEEIIDSASAYGAASSDSVSSKYDVGVQVFLVVGTVAVLLIALIVLRKRQ